jgi:hypothetical protein
VCKECDALWGEYADKTRDHIRAMNKQHAAAERGDYETFRNLESVVMIAACEREEARLRIKQLEYSHD